MRRASSSLLSSLSKSNHLSVNLLSNLFLHLPLRNHSPIYPSHLAPSSNPYSQSSLRCPSHRSIQTQPWIPPSSRSYTPEMESNPAPEEIIAAFEALESSLGGEDDKRLGVACLEVGEKLESFGSEELDKALAFALRAVKIFEKSDGGWSFSVAKALRLMGSISCKMKRFEESLEALNTADEILGALEKEGCGESDVGLVRIAVQIQLASTKTAMGRRWEALVNLRRSVELKDLILEPNSLELGTAYKDLAEAYTVVLDFKEALPLCSKAMDIYKEQFGLNSMEVSQLRRLLGVIYVGLGENEKALEQSEVSMRVLEGLGLVTELLQVGIDVANIQISLGRLDEAINMLKRVIQQAEKDSETRAFVLVAMARALCCQEKFGESRRCLEIACGILDKKEAVCAAKVAEAYAEISMLYETMSEFETSLSLMKRTLAILETLPDEQHLEGSILARIGWLLLLTKRVPQAVPYLDSAIEKLKNCFGSKHFGLGFVFKHLGEAHLDMDQPQSAVKFLTLARDIIDISFGSDHEDSIDINQLLANAYGIMGSYTLAMDSQQRVIDAWERHGSSAIEDLREAHRLLQQLKKKAQGSPSAVFPANSLPLLPQK
ncbi:protein KINESIN LIGHT CHAIN-RELATED 2-like [Typha angustifolia]|uniref:protein KINESIN LIGHT CHAIN-RELATED 2-like n=1 Tax=Typha angustifolia TaxID=59011 RepID=UPI003C2BAF28